MIRNTPTPITRLVAASSRPRVPRAAGPSADSGATIAQEPSPTPKLEAIRTNQSAEQTFPDSWVGTWRGKLNIVGGSYDGQVVDMSLQIAPLPDTPRYTWTIRYGEEPARQYELLPVDAAQGHWVVDEKNGILIDSYLMDGVFLSQFDVYTNRVTARYEEKDGDLEVEMHTFSREPVRRSGPDGDVAAFDLRSLHRARLKRSD